jgi:hypothetical protein
MASEKQTAANRRNAKKSTGPKSASGKAASSQNALKHGVLSEHVVADGEDEEKFLALLEQLVRDCEPVTAMESCLVERVAILLWRERRLARAEKLSLETLPGLITGYLEDVAKRAEDPFGRFLGFTDQLLIGRYQTMLTNQIRQTLELLHAEQKHRLESLEAASDAEE